MRFFAALAVIFLCFPLASLLAADPTLDSLELGKHLYGEKWDLESLKGRTVLAFFWDTE